MFEAKQCYGISSYSLFIIPLQVPGFRCCSFLVEELMGNLSLKQRGWVKNIGFSDLENLKGSRAPKSLALWLVDRVETKKRDTPCLR